MLGIVNAKSRFAVAENAKKWNLSATLSVSLAGNDGSFAGSAGALSRRDYGAWLDLLIPVGREATDLQEWNVQLLHHPERHLGSHRRTGGGSSTRAGQAA